MYVDVKVTVWQRIQLNEDESVTEQKVIEMLKENEPYIGCLWRDERLDPYCETIDDTEEYITIADNNGNCTVELYDNNGKLIWENCKND
jgi:hypothetical protein